MANEPHARAALTELDKVLTSKPHVEGHTMSVAASELSLLRDEMAARQRQIGPTADSRRRLEHVNAVISVVLAGHFPIGEVPWPELRRARDWLAALAGDAGTDK